MLLKCCTQYASKFGKLSNSHRAGNGGRAEETSPRRVSHVQLFVTLWTIAHQAPLSLGFCRQEYWSGLSCLPPWDLPDPGIEPRPLM